MLLREHVYCVAIALKMSNRSASNFVLSLNVPPWKLRMIQKATAMAIWGLAASSPQCACSCITSRAEIFGKTSNHPGDSVPLQLRFGALRLLAFPKTKITFEREQIIDH